MVPTFTIPRGTLLRALVSVQVPPFLATTAVGVGGFYVPRKITRRETLNDVL